MEIQNYHELCAPWDVVTFVRYRLLETGKELTAVLASTEMASGTVTAHDIVACIANQYGIPPQDIQLCGAWGDRYQREMNEGVTRRHLLGGLGVRP